MLYSIMNTLENNNSSMQMWGTSKFAEYLVCWRDPYFFAMARWTLFGNFHEHTIGISNSASLHTKDGINTNKVPRWCQGEEMNLRTLHMARF
jgi:hypothetical protein